MALKEIPLSQITEAFFVRDALNADRVAFFESLYAAGAKVDPLKVTADGKNILVGGRHRLKALKNLNRRSIECELIDVKPGHDLIMAAVEDNLNDGPLPMTAADVIHIMESLLNQKLSRVSILRDFAERTKYPPAVLRRWMSNAQSNYAERQIVKAKTDVLERGLSVPVASKKHDIDEGQLRRALGGKKTAPKHGIAEIKSGISSRFKSHGMKNGVTVRQLGDKLMDQEITFDQAVQILTHFERLIGREASSMADHKKRFIAKYGSGAVKK